MTLLEQVQRYLDPSIRPGQHFTASPSKYADQIRAGLKLETLHYGIPELDRHCPYKQGQLVTIVGNPNVGKSFFVVYLLALLIHKYKKKVLIYSAENYPHQISRWLIQCAHRSHDHGSHLDWLDQHVRLIEHEKQFTYSELLEQAAIVQDDGEFPFDVFFIDPYNALRLERDVRNTHEWHYEAIEAMRIFTKKQNKTIFLNCHTNTEAQRERVDDLGHSPVPLASFVEGGGKFISKSDDVIVTHRQIHAKDEYERKVTLVRVSKVKHTECGGYPTPHKQEIRLTFRDDWCGFTWDQPTTQSAMPLRNWFEPEKKDSDPF